MILYFDPAKVGATASSIGSLHKNDQQILAEGNTTTFFDARDNEGLWNEFYTVFNRSLSNAGITVFYSRSLNTFILFQNTLK